MLHENPIGIKFPKTIDYIGIHNLWIMGGGGFMKHAVETNQRHLQQKEHRRSVCLTAERKNVSGNSHSSTVLSFPQADEEQIRAERERLQQLFKKRRSQKWTLISMSVLITFLILTGIVYLLSK